MLTVERAKDAAAALAGLIGAAALTGAIYIGLRAANWIGERWQGT